MHRVLQQKWINGRVILLEDGELEDVLDILNLPSDTAGKLKEAEPVSGVSEADYHEQDDLSLTEETQVDLLENYDEEPEAEAAEEVSVEVIKEATDLDQKITEEMDPESGTAAEEAVETLEEEPVSSDREMPDQVATWYYWPNGSLIKS